MEMSLKRIFTLICFSLPLYLSACGSDGTTADVTDSTTDSTTNGATSGTTNSTTDITKRRHYIDFSTTEYDQYSRRQFRHG